MKENTNLVDLFIKEESDDSPPLLRASWAIIGECEDVPLCARGHTHAHPSDAKNIMVTDLIHLQSSIYGQSQNYQILCIYM